MYGNPPGLIILISVIEIRLTENTRGEINASADNVLYLHALF